MIPSYRFPQKWTQVNITAELDKLFGYKKPHNWLFVIQDKYKSNIYGGFLEDRSKLLDSRHDINAPIHLGIDFWAPERTPVYFPLNPLVSTAKPKLIYSHTKNSIGGWGGRKDYLYGPFVYIFSHLDSSLLHKDILKVGVLGDRSTNGGWMPHLHLQILYADYYNKVSHPDMDAYAPINSDMINYHVNPIELL